MLDVKNEIRELTRLVAHHKRLYFEENAPIISDQEYDQLFAKLKKLEEQYPEYMVEDSPTKQVGTSVSDNGIKHIVKMLSLDNVFSIEELKQFFSNKNTEGAEFWCDIKMDGLALECVYKDRKLVRVVTRGDGISGYDVTKTAVHLSDIPLMISHPGVKNITVGGEMMMSKEAFVSLNMMCSMNSSEKVYSNPRNAVSGIIQRKFENIPSGFPKLKFYAYKVMEATFSDDVVGKRPWRIFKKYSSQMKFLISNGFNIIPVNVVIDSLDKFESFKNQIEKIRHVYPFGIDGIVIKLNNLALAEELGDTATAPRGAVAYKFQATKYKTIIRDICLFVGRTGTLVPVAVVDPVTVDGVVITKATLHNMNTIINNDIRIGDKVFIQRSGDVIPYISDIIVSERDGSEFPYETPSECPYCSHGLVKTSSGFSCVNNRCSARIKEYIKHFVSSKGLNMKGLGEQLVVTMLNMGMITSPSDLFKLKKSDLYGLPNFGTISVNNLFEILNKPKRYVPLDRFISALGIPNIGLTLSRVLASQFHSLDNILNATFEDLIKIDGIGEETSRAFIAFINDEANSNMIKELRLYGIEPEKYIPLNKNTGVFAGRVVCFSGTFDHHRLKLQEIFERNGATISKGITKKVTHLYLGNHPSENKKRQANKYDIQISNSDKLYSEIKEFL